MLVERLDHPEEQLALEGSSDTGVPSTTPTCAAISAVEACA
jgi:hypothetical protein